MNINFFPKAFVESFTLSDLRIVARRIEEFCYADEYSEWLPFLKWEQTLGLQKFNKRVIRDSYIPSNIVGLDKIKSPGWSDFDRKKVYLLDFDLLLRDQISNLLLKNMGAYVSEDVSLQPSKCYLLIARKSMLNRFIRKILKGNIHLSWVGFDPNLRVQIGMNDYIELESVYETCFVVFKA